MRTTITLDDDVTALLRRARQVRQSTMKEVVNEALRPGLREMITPVPPSAPYRTRTVSLGRCLVGNLDDIAELLAVEGENSRDPP